MDQTDLEIQQGKTFIRVVRWESLPFIFAPITGISRAAPAVVQSAGHGAPNGWRVAIVSVVGMEQINASNPPKDRQFVKARVTLPNELTLSSVNSSDYDPYESGGYIQYYTPVDLAGYTGRMKIRNKVGGTLLASTEVADSPLDVITVDVDNAEKTITIRIEAADTALFTWKRGVYDFEMISGTGDVTALLSGNITVTPEVTT